MPTDASRYLASLLPLAACSDPAAIAFALERLAHLALLHGHALCAERLARRVAALRKAGR